MLNNLRFEARFNSPEESPHTGYIILQDGSLEFGTCWGTNLSTNPHHLTLVRVTTYKSRAESEETEQESEEETEPTEDDDLVVSIGDEAIEESQQTEPEEDETGDYTTLYVGLGTGCCLTWIIFQDPQPLIDFFERIRVELQCDWFLSINERDYDNG